MADHQRGKSKGQFCGIPGTPCGCTEANDYIEICKPGWANFTFPRLVKKKTGSSSFGKKYEAHHILCVAPVSSEVVARTKIAGLVRNTQWCINNKTNMIGMPLWGHTVMWYCSIIASGGSIKTTLTPPPFADIPQHDWDHNCTGGYTDEVKDELKSLAKDAEDAGHGAAPDDLKAALDELSGEFESRLKTRGARPTGTHAGWQDGMADPNSTWYMSFSMASTAFITKKGFPVRDFNSRVADWIDKIAAAL